MTVTIFAKDNDVRPLLDDLETELRSVSFRMMDGKILSNEVFMNHNDSFNASKLYGLPSNVAFLFDPMKRFMKPMETGVRFGVDFFSGNEFKVSILDMVSKNKEDLSLEGAPHAVIT